MKQKDGLIIYPKGRSAMVHYGCGVDLGVVLDHALGFFEENVFHRYMCRHALFERPQSCQEKFIELIARFEYRFGQKPILDTK